MNIPRATVLVVIAVLLTSGCATSEPETTSPPPVAESPSATPTPEPTKPAYADLVLTTEGLDYLAIGSPIEERDPSTALAVWAEGHCDDVNPDVEGAWIANYPEVNDAFYFRTDGREGALTRIMVKKPGVTTDEGISVGSTEGDVTATYPDATIVTENPSTHMYVIEGESGRLLIEVAVQDGLGAEIGTVAFMSSVEIDGDVWGIANTGAGASCEG